MSVSIISGLLSNETITRAIVRQVFEVQVVPGFGAARWVCLLQCLDADWDAQTDVSAAAAAVVSATSCFLYFMACYMCQ